MTSFGSSGTVKETRRLLLQRLGGGGVWAIG